MERYLSDRFQRVVLNKQTSSWRSILPGVPQGFMLGPLLFRIYINDMPASVKSNVKLFADDTSIFSIVNNKNDSIKELTHDFSLISKWAFTWKMVFNPDPTKHAQEVISRKKDTSAHPNIVFNDIPVERASHHKNLGIYLDQKLNFKMHIETVSCNVNKDISIIKKLSHALPRKSLQLSTKRF